VAVVSVALLINGTLELWFSYQEHKASLIRIQREQAEAAAAKIGQFVKEIESQLGWTTQLPWSASTVDQRRFDGLRLLRQVPAITELSMVDAAGKEQLRVSRLAMDVLGSGLDLSEEPKFAQAAAKKVYYGPVYFRRESEPYMTLSLAGTRRDSGVSIAEVNLKLIWEVVSKIKVGERGQAYVVDANGRLIAHPDISLVLRNTDMSALSQVQAARAADAAASEAIREAKNAQGKDVLAAFAPVPPLGWHVLVELPVDEAYAPLYGSMQRTGLVMLAALFAAALSGMFLARRMVGPIQTLREGAARIGNGDLGQRIEVRTGDEVEALAREFNDMAGRLQESYADLEKKVVMRTRELSEALARQTATAEVLQAISRSTFDLETVLNTLVESAANLCEADIATITKQKDGRFYRTAIHGFPPDFAERMKAIPVNPDRGTATGRAMLEGRTIHIADVTSDPDYAWTEAQEAGGFRALMGVPLLRDGIPIGAMALGRQEARPFTDKQIELVSTFADQAVIAIENARLFEEVQARTRDLQESLEYQTATSEVLNVISRSPSDIRPVLDTIVDTATRLCNVRDAIIFLRKGDRLNVVARKGPLPPLDFEALPLDLPGWVAGRAVLERRAIHVEDVLAAQAEYPESHRQALLFGHRTILVAPLVRGAEAIGAIAIRRAEVRPFAERQIAVLQTFADQAVIALENVRLFEEVQARTRELQESLHYQTGNSEVLHVISRSTFDIQPVLDTIAETARRLCNAFDALIFLRDGETLSIASHRGPIPVDFDSFPLRRGWLAGRAVLDKTPVHVDDLLAEHDEYPDGYAMAVRFGHRTTLATPLIREGESIGVIVIRRTEVRAFSDKQVAVLQTFADQAVIAIENVRLFDQVQARTRELQEALEYQTATSDVLGVISRSPTHLQPALQSIVEIAAGLCEGFDATILLREGDLLRVGAHRGAIPLDFETKAVTPGWITGRAVVDRRPVHVHDFAAERDQFPEGYDLHLRQGHRTGLAIPLLQRGEAIGAFMIRRKEVCPFSDKQVAVLQTFADQAVIAINNVRLFEEVQARTGEVQEALEYQTATSDVLGVISRSPSELQPVMDAIVSTAARLCSAEYSFIVMCDETTCRLVAANNIELAHNQFLARNPVAINRDTVAGRTALEKTTIHIPDVLADPEFKRPDWQAVGKQRTVLGVPLLREGRLLGVMILARTDVRPFSEKQVELVTTFADQAVIAINNVRLFEEVQARTQELARSVSELQALGEVTRAVNSTLDLEKVLETIVAKAVQLSGTDAGAIYVYSAQRREYRLRATYGMDEDLVRAVRRQTGHLGSTSVRDAVAKREPVQVPDLHDEPPSPIRDLVLQAGYRAVLIVPLLRPDQVLGALVVRRREPGEFDEATKKLLMTFAEQSVLAIQNARLFSEIEEKGRQLELASRHKSQFLANMSHELRTPLNSVLGFTEMIADGLYGPLPDKAKNALVKVQANGKHLLGLINDVLDLSKIEAGQLTLSLDDYSLGQLVGTVVTGTESLARAKGLEMTASVPPALPIGRGDERRLTQVVINLVGNAIKFTDAGSVEIVGRFVDGSFEIDVRDTGPGVAPEDQKKIFDEFQQVDDSSTRKKGGTGLGLAISRRIVEMHGGTLSVQSVVGEGSTFTMRVPVRVEESREAA
jgi:GAF domain-containing protein/HAMP domain-containing protein